MSHKVRRIPLRMASMNAPGGPPHLGPTLDPTPLQTLTMLRSLALAIATVLMAGQVAAFQIAPMGSQFEARLTNETPSNLAKVAGRLGVLLKSPVHEEITQLGYSCAAEPGSLNEDTACAGANVGFANHFVIYGVRWNDLPPFRLNSEEGSNCSYLGQAVCRTDQTVRFSTQPLCWFCLFKDAEQKAKSAKISGCARGKDVIRGNLMTRSHFGDLQFLHGMASEEGEDASVTQTKILGWLEFAWKVASREIKSDAFLRDIDIPTIKEHFGCSEWRVSDIYILGRQDGKTGLINQVHQIAFGSALHTVQDSFAGAHTSREASAKAGLCEGTTIERPPRVVEFHTYGAQDGHLHDAQDARAALVAKRPADGWPDAVIATRQLVELYSSNAKWDQAQHYLRCLFDTVEQPNRASAGENFRRAHGN